MKGTGCRPAKAFSRGSDQLPLQPSDGGDVALAFVGSVVADAPRHHNPAFSRAGNMSQSGLLAGWRNAGLDPCVFSFAPEPAFPSGKRVWVPGGPEEISPGIVVRLVGYINITIIKQLAIGLSIAMAVIAWGWRCRRVKRRVVFAYNLTMPPGVFTWVAARLVRAKAVVFVNDINIPGQTVPASLRFRCDFAMQKFLMRHFDGLVTVSDRIANDFVPGKPYLRVDGGIRLEILDKTDDWLKPRKSRPFTVVAAGGLDAANGIPLMLDAFSMIRGDGFRFLLAGAGPLQGVVETATSLDPRIEFRGFLPLDRVLELYCEADLLLNVRITQALDTRYFFPSKLMECLASGVPVLTTATGHACDEYGRWVYVLEQETPAALAALIESIARVPRSERLEKASGAREYMRREKTWDAQAKRMFEHLQAVMVGDQKQTAVNRQESRVSK